MDLQALRSQSINKIREQFDELSGLQLLQLRALEIAEEAPRATLIKAIDDKFEELKAIDDKLEELGATSPASDTESNTQAPPESEGANDPVEAAAPRLGVDSTGEAPASSAPAWQAPDYCGPLTGDQALWRVANLKAR